MKDVSRTTLEDVVSHFQTLFDVHKISGVYPRMNEIYKAIGEAQNVQNTLKNLLGLRKDIHKLCFKGIYVLLYFSIPKI